MANSIELAARYSDLLDEVYKQASKTNDLTSPDGVVRMGVNANEIYYPQIDVSGLGDYDRNSGYTDGSVNVVWKSAVFNYDRGTKISVDAMDDEETFNIAFGRASSELMRTRVAPEGDAFTFATLAGKEGVTAVTESYTGGEDFLEALLAAKSAMDEAEVTEEGRILYATPTLLNAVLGLDTYKSREALNSFARRVAVPQSRFYTAIDLLDGKSDGETAGHYQMSEGGANINFMIVEPSCLIKWDKHVVSSVISPDNNPDSDAYIVKYRKYGIVDVFANKVAGIYISHQ
ncbi:MAG: hypothetical protein LUC30_10300 [Clostridiales bacterium]|nr:hypothetical protein [Clostridiales bacterium]